MFIQLHAKDFASWRIQARDMLARQIQPDCVQWMDTLASQPSLALEYDADCRLPDPPAKLRLAVPNQFLALAKRVACHASPDRWNPLYRTLWRISVEGDRSLLSKPNDPDVSALALMDKAVRRERHKMTAFVRFRRVEVSPAPPEGRESYVAWYEPVHDVLRLAAPFFRDRFASMNWSILTPRASAHWDGRELRYTEGVGRESAPRDDELETYWKSYYASIFNPARLNIRMMEREMPRRYWKNLPEADLISELAGASYGRASKMVEELEVPRSRPRPRGAPDGSEHPSCQSPDQIRWVAEDKTLEQLRDLASRCQACQLCEAATQTVWGEGPSAASLFVVGEQPGDQEDIVGQPFVGPAGQLLSEAMESVGLDRTQIYLTNAVKHFRWKPSGKRRLHQRPSPVHVASCQPWLAAELGAVRPRVVLCLGATAARAIAGRELSIEKCRGPFDDPALPYRIVFTYHPSYLLRLEDTERRARVYREFCDDLKLASALAEQ